MKKIRAVRFIAAIAWALSGIAMIGFVSEPVLAAEKKKDQGPKIGAKVGKPLKAAQELTQKKKWAEALAKVKEAEAISGKTPFEQFTVLDFKAYININLKNYAEVVRAYEATIDSEFLPPAEKPRRLKVVTQLHYQNKEYPESIKWGERYLKATGNRDSEVQLLIGQAYYLQKDFANAGKAVRAAIAMEEKAGKKPKEEWFQLVQSSEYETKNDSGLASALEGTLKYYPSPKYWGDRIRLLEDKAKVDVDNRLNLDIYRLKLATNSMEDPAEFVEMAEFALEFGYPGEAKTAMQKGFDLGVIKAANDQDRNKRLLSMASQQATADQKSLAAFEKEAAKAKTGDPEVKLGEAYVSYGQYDQGIAALQRGLAKGGLKNADESQLHLGVAYLNAGKKDEAKKELAAVKAETVYGELASLWTIFADVGAGTVKAEAAPAAAAK